MKKIIVQLLKNAIKEEKLKIKEEEIENLLEIPPSAEMGDYAFPCFVLANQLKESPVKIALAVRANIGKIPKELEDIQTSGAYINFFVDRKNLAIKTISNILRQEELYGKNISGKGKKVLMEFSQPNTHKAFHVGHIRGTALGESLARISEFSGSKIIRANYSGDTGMHIAKWIWCYQKYHSKEKPKNDESWIASIYVDAVKRLSKSEKLQKQVDEINLKLTARENFELTKLWEKTRKFSINSWEKIYKELGVNFDVHYFESEMEKPSSEIVDELMKKHIAVESDGAVIVNLEKDHLGIWVLLRKDKTLLYSAKDLALAQKKYEDYNPNEYLVVVGDEQDLHFRQLEKTLELMKFKNADKYRHVPFGMIRLPYGKMSSRTGDNILYSDFIKELINYSKKGIKSRAPKISQKGLEERALKISIAAIKYSFLKQNPKKLIIFRKEDALSFEGDTGPYLQYSYARASSILRKAKIKETNFKIRELEPKEYELVKKLSQFPASVFNAHQTLNPSLIANYSYQLAQIFNEFYHACPVIGSKEKEVFRIKIVEAFRQILKNALYLLGIEAVEEM